MEQTPLISIIIPVYNTEQYLGKCLDSVIFQTYKNLQIILVDDGSTDNSPSICDDYAKADSRITVMHQKNAGVSAARNTGLAAVKGEWIGWVDSDDWIEPEMFARMIEAGLVHNTDIVICGRIEEYRNSAVSRGWNKEDILSREDAVRALLENDRIQNYLWDKLWKKDLFDGMIFPEGRTYEDIALMGRLFEKSDTVLCIPDAYYHYNQRQGSIVDDTSLGNRINHFLAAKYRLEEMGPHWPQYQHLMEAQCVASSICVWSCCYANPRRERKKYNSLLKEMAAYASEHYKNVDNAIGLGLAGKIIVRLTPYATPLAFWSARIIGLGYKLKHGREL